jgi:predicted nuclease of predicted toxin-antitoxin system
LRLLFDQNISPKIIRRLGSEFSESVHVNNSNLLDASDSKIFEFAKMNNFTIVTFDSDFVDLSIVKGFPPKIIWLKTRNQTTQIIVEILSASEVQIQAFIESPSGGILEIIRT